MQTVCQHFEGHAYRALPPRADDGDKLHNLSRDNYKAAAITVHVARRQFLVQLLLSLQRNFAMAAIERTVQTHLPLSPASWITVTLVITYTREARNSKPREGGRKEVE